ncbi:MAG TPA: RbsD/FucU family protein [Bacteroidales bacterium]|jgi:L-fucose mutarotase|nr:RbsD/FucU family protein [Bacteroidales bacterium]
MLKTKLLHPEILSVLGSNGHGSRILIADGNYPFTTGVPGTARKVFLNLAPGMFSVPDVLKIISDAVPVESCVVMLPPDETPQLIHEEFIGILGNSIPVTKVKRFDFYKEARSGDTCLVIATGEMRRFANILITIGVVKF